MRQWSQRRAQYVDDMNRASDDAARRTAMMALHDFDRGYMDRVKQQRPSDESLWLYDGDETQTVNDSMLAALQLDAVFQAEADLDQIHGLADHQKFKLEALHAYGTSDTSLEWCGYHALKNIQRAGFNPELRDGIGSTIRLDGYSTYSNAYVVGDAPKWIKADGTWQDTKAYHATRQSPRARMPPSSNGFDVRPGDLMRTDKHIQMIHSVDFTTTPWTVFYIDGNGYGWEPWDTKMPIPKGEDHDRERIQHAVGRTVYPPTGAGGHVGVGIRKLSEIVAVFRPSLVDFERHSHSNANAKPTK
jgi:hypothetical protein